MNKNSFGEIVFENDDYSNSIVTGLGSFIPHNGGGLPMQIINNIRTVNYNFEYKFHNEVSLLSILLFDRTPIDRAIRRVIYSIDITTKNMKVEDKEYEYACDKKSFSKLVLSGRRKIILVNPELWDKNKLISDYKFRCYMKKYLEVIVRYCIINSRKILNSILKELA